MLFVGFSNILYTDLILGHKENKTEKNGFLKPSKTQVN